MPDQLTPAQKWAIVLMRRNSGKPTKKVTVEMLWELRRSGVTDRSLLRMLNGQPPRKRDWYLTKDGWEVSLD